MTRDVPQDFQLKLNAWNDSHPGPAQVAACWDPVKERWTVWAIPLELTNHPLARNKLTVEHFRSFPDGSGRRGILLFDWCEHDKRGRDLGFLPLDDRVFQVLHMCDSHRDKRHFEQTFEDPDVKREMAHQKAVLDVMMAARSYYHNLDNLTVGPYMKGSGDWRHRIR